MNPKRVESESMPPSPIDVTKGRLVVPFGLVATATGVVLALLGATLGAGAALEKMPDTEDVELIATRASEAAVKASIAEDTPRRLAVQHQIDELAKSHQSLAQSMARLSTSVTRLEVYNEIQATSSVHQSSPRAARMRRNIVAGRDPLEGIVPSETRD